MFFLILIVIWCSVLGVWSWLKPRRPSPPRYPGALPLIGHGYLFLGDYTQLWKVEKKVYDYCLKKQDVVEFKLGPISSYAKSFCVLKDDVDSCNLLLQLGQQILDLIISDPDAGLTVANNCLEKPYFYQFGKSFFDRGLVTANLNSWKPHRKLLNPAFNQQLLHAAVKEYSIQASLLVSQLASKVGLEPFDVLPHLSKNILGTVYRTSMGLKTGENDDTVKKYFHATEALFAIYRRRMQVIWLHLPQIFNRTSLKKQENICTNLLIDITNEVIKKRRSKLKLERITSKKSFSASENFKPLVDQLLGLADKQDAFSDDEIREHMDTFVSAAYDSTATTIAFTLLALGSHQDMQERVYKELQEVLGDKDKPFNCEDISKLVYMEATIKEALRVYPPVPRIARSSSCEVKLKDYTLPAHSIFILSVYAINRHPMWGPDADQFRPERWLDPATLPDNPNAFFSFSIGKRNCIGKFYAMMAMKTTIAQILRNFRVISDISKLQTYCDLFLKPIAGHHIRLESRV